MGLTQEYELPFQGVDGTHAGIQLGVGFGIRMRGARNAVRGTDENFGTGRDEKDSRGAREVFWTEPRRCWRRRCAFECESDMGRIETVNV
jgi:hypothetical protein